MDIVASNGVICKHDIHMVYIVLYIVLNEM